MTYTHATRRQIAGSLVMAVLSVGGLTACGDSADEKRLQAEQLESAREEGRREARAAAEASEAKQEAAKLAKEVEKLKREKGPSTTQATTATPAAAAPTSGSPCGDGVSAGSSATTCPFALNVAEEYRRSSGASNILVDSPVTKQTYSMSCSSGSPTICRGGNNAVVYIR